MWLDSAYGSDKGLVIPGTPVRYAADFRLSVDGVHIEKVGIDVALPWAETGKLWHLGSYVRRRNSITLKPERAIDAIRRDHQFRPVCEG